MTVSPVRACRLAQTRASNGESASDDSPTAFRSLAIRGLHRLAMAVPDTVDRSANLNAMHALRKPSFGVRNDTPWKRFLARAAGRRAWGLDGTDDGAS